MEKKPRIVTMLAIVFSLSGLSGTACYAQPHWSIQLEPMYMGVFGNEPHVADIATTTTTTTTTFFPTFTSTSTSTTTNESIDLGPAGDFALRGQIEFRPSQWGIGLSGWGFDTDVSASQALNSGLPLPPIPFPPPPTITTTSTSIVYNSNNFSLFVPPGGMLRAAAKNELEVWNIDVYGLRTLAERPSLGLDLTFGAKLASLDKELSESAASQSLTVETFGSFSSSFNGRVTRSADANVLAGPALGLQAHAAYGRHRFQGLLSQSVLIGDVDRKAVSQTESFSSFNGLFFSSSSRTSSRESFSSSKTVLIPVTELKLNYLYAITEHLSLGVGVFASVWVDTPGASATTPPLSAPTTILVGADLSGFAFPLRAPATATKGIFGRPSLSRFSNDTLGFLGGMVALNYRF